MKFWELIKIANRNLLRNKLRTLLTVLAIFVGSFTLVLTNGLGAGLRDYVEYQVKNVEGRDVLFVRKKIERQAKESESDAPAEYKEETQNEAGNRIDPNSFLIPQEQMESAAKEIPEIKSTTPNYNLRASYITLDGDKKYRLGLAMLSDGMTQKTEVGRTIKGPGEVLIPLSVARAFNQDIAALIGRDVTIGYKVGQPPAQGEMKTMRLTIVGVATKGFMTNYSSFVDATTAKKIYEDQSAGQPNFNNFSGYSLKLDNDSDQTIETVKKKLDEKGFTVDSIADREKRTYDAIGILQIGLNFFAFIALLAASFGIINTLVVAVMERTKEIGLQKALGMGRWVIFALFSLESVLIGFWGATAGVVGGIFLGTVTSLILGNTYLESFEGYSLFSFKPLAIIFVMLLVCITAFLAGVMPAFRASRLNPIEALRYE